MAQPTVVSGFLLLLLLLLLIRNGDSRYLEFNSSLELVSDGLHDGIIHEQSPLQLLKDLEASQVCKHMYGFLPCTDNLMGHLFQIVVYMYLLFLGEAYVTCGSEIAFTILGPGLFGASAFHILGALPQAMIVLVSGLSKSKERAQEHVMTAVGMLAGSTIFILTMLWGTCLFLGTRKFPKTLESEDSTSNPASDDSPFRKHLSSITGSGVTIDIETMYTARIMFGSLVPFVILQIPIVFRVHAARRVVIIASLIISVVSLFSYFFYQSFKPWIQKRRLEFVKNRHLMDDILKHVERHASGKLLTHQGAPNLLVIRRLFGDFDLNKDEHITVAEVKNIIREIKTEKLHQDGINVVMKELDTDGNQRISEEEFVTGFTKLLLKTKHANKRFCTESIVDDLYKQRLAEFSRSKHLMTEISKHAQKNGLGSLVTDDGEPNLSVIKRLFESMDHDRNNCISLSELTNAMQGIKFENEDLHKDEVVAHLMKELDKNEDQQINEEEFVDGFSKLLGSKTTLDDIYLDAWKATEKVVDEKESRGLNVDSLLMEWAKAICLLLLGTIILSLLSQPLIGSVQSFSAAANIPSFFVSFVVLPLATNSRKARSAIISASKRKPRTTSLAFSEIYGGAFMNNILGLSILLSIIYARNLAWDFSAEVLIILVICAIMGAIGSLHSRIPLWTCFVAYLLYPFSLAFVYVLDNAFGWV